VAISVPLKGCPPNTEPSGRGRRCRYCEQPFEPSKYRPDQSACSQPDCQRQRRTDDHRRRLATDTDYAQSVRESQKQWRQAHSDYPRQYRQKCPVGVDRNRQQQGRRDQRRRFRNLAKNNVALDLKRCAGEVWLMGPGAADLGKNNLAACQFYIFQPVAAGLGPTG
jgi:hypothetical protein